VRTSAAPYTESRLAHLVRNKCVGFPVVEQTQPNIFKQEKKIFKLEKQIFKLEKRIFKQEKRMIEQ
jgi:hypothetical protein